MTITMFLHFLHVIISISYVSFFKSGAILDKIFFNPVFPNIEDQKTCGNTKQQKTQQYQQNEGTQPVKKRCDNEEAREEAASSQPPHHFFTGCGKVIMDQNKKQIIYDWYVHLRCGCRQARNIASNVYSDKHADITCPDCRAFIQQHNLVERSEFPALPVFSVTFESPDQRFARWDCPCCGKVRYIGRMAGHRPDPCGCWQSGVDIVLMCLDIQPTPPAPQPPAPQPPAQIDTELQRQLSDANLPDEISIPSWAPRMHFRSGMTIGCGYANRHDTTDDPTAVTCGRCLKFLRKQQKQSEMV